MAHHSSEMDPDMAERIREQFGARHIESILGATGRFTHEKLTEQDEGEILVGLAVTEGKVILSFGETTVNWLGLTPSQAREIGQRMIERADEAETGIDAPNPQKTGARGPWRDG